MGARPDWRKNPRDERAILIEITAQGNALREHALDVPSQMMQRLNLSEEKVVELCEILGSVVNAGISAPRE